MVIVGVRATDIQTLNTALGAAIEDQVVQTLNEMRQVWDPDQAHQEFSFARQAQTFPDVVLARASSPGDIILGLELKGWYLLAKETEPSFRFTVTPAACAPQDLIAIYPWALAQVISGTPKVFTPFVESARYAAEYKNYYWQHVMKGKLPDRSITPPPGVAPYPLKTASISDVAAHDQGGNFGRLARTGLMDAFTTAAGKEPIAGIQARHWRAFFKIYVEKTTDAAIDQALTQLSKTVTGNLVPGQDESVQGLRDKLIAIASALQL